MASQSVSIAIALTSVKDSKRVSKAANNPELHDQQSRLAQACSTQTLAEARDTAVNAPFEPGKTLFYLLAPDSLPDLLQLYL